MSTRSLTTTTRYALWWAAVTVETAGYCVEDAGQWLAQKARRARRRAATNRVR